MKVIKLKMVVLVGGLAIGYTGKSQSGLQWAREISGASYDIAQSVATGNSGRIYAAGVFKQEIDFGSGSKVSSAGLGDMFIAGYDADGKLLWSRVAGGSGMDMVRSLAVDPNENVISAGCFEGQIDLDPGNSVVMAGGAGNQNVFVSKYTSAGKLIWAKNISSAEYITCNSVKSDEKGNIYFTGSFRTEIDFDPGSGTSLVLPQGRMRDLYIVKLNSEGDFEWVRTFPVVCDDIGTGFVVDGKNEVVLAGSFYGMDPVDLDPSASVHMVQPKSTEDLFFLKLSTAGDLLWVNHMNGTFYNGRAAMAVNSDLEIFFAGNFHGTVDVDPSGSAFQLVSNGQNPDAFVAKYSADGQFKWAQQIGGIEVQQSNALSVFENSEVILTGLFQGSMDADPGQEEYNLNSAGKEDVFMIRLNSDGNFLCAGNMGGQGSDRSGSAQFDKSGNLLVTGSFAATADLDPGSTTYVVTPQTESDLYVCKIASCGLMTSVSEQINIDNFKIFPNPTQGELTIWSAVDEVTEVRVLNVLGAEILRQPLKMGNNAINLTGFPKGIYFACLIRDNDQQPIIRKVLVQ